MSILVFKTFRRRKWATILAILASVVGTASEGAKAAIVYDNGAPNGLTGNETTLWLQTEDFSLGTASYVTGACVYIAGFGGISTWDGTVEYFVFADAPGQPGTLLTSGAGNNVMAIDTGAPWGFGGNTYKLDFNFASQFTAAAGTTYWFGIHLAADYLNRDEIYWVTTDPTFGNGTESFEGTLNNWSSNGQEHAFALKGSPVPEPSSLAILGLATVSLTFARRRLRKG